MSSVLEVKRLVAAANAVRWPHDPSTRTAGSGEAERQLEALFGTSRTLAVYGTLAPGRANHHIVAPLGGRWTEGIVEGDLVPAGWGATLGYPAFRPREGGAAVPVHVLVSPSLPARWPDLDEFEGAGYQRILVPVLSGEERRLSTVANLYAATEPFQR